MSEISTADMLAYLDRCFCVNSTLEAIRAALLERDALRDQMDEYVRVVGEQQSQIETLKAEVAQLKGLWEHERDSARSWIDEAATQRKRAEKAEAELAAKEGK